MALVCVAFAGCAQDRSTAASGDGHASRDSSGISAAQPLVIGESFTIDSRIMGEVRHMNVFVPTVYGEKIDAPMPVLYMPDGGMNEDFLHIAGLMQVLVCNGGMRPCMLVGIQNTQRRRDMTGPTTNPEDRKIAPVVGGSANFRRFIKEELIPAVRSRYRTTDEAGIIGESAAGLFVVETFILEPELFEIYIAIDPSLWWNNAELLNTAKARLASGAGSGASVFIASSDEPVIAGHSMQLAGIFDSHPVPGLRFRHAPMGSETHGTIYHPAAIVALRTVLGPAGAEAK